jgi:hypothetical protein
MPKTSPAACKKFSFEVIQGLDRDNDKAALEAKLRQFANIATSPLHRARVS